jgi:hypothetical protein
MALDRSRSTFDVRKPKHWSSALAQQGRLLTDDDFNEADEITKEDLRRSRVDIIGNAGSPDDGFKIVNPRVAANQIDFDLTPGTMYVGGIRVTLEETETFALQKDWLQQSVTDRPALTTTDRIDHVYLEVWQQPVTAVEDRELREIALGGPDTSVRMRTMRRVRVLPNMASESCTVGWNAVSTALGIGPDNERTNNATLRIGYLPNTAPAAENQALRVEIGTAPNTLIWGYDNASQLYRVNLTTDGSGAQVIQFQQPPHDEAHWPLAQQIVELLPWSAVLPNGEKIAEHSGGFLSKVTKAYDPNDKTIKIQSIVPNTFGTTWQSRSDAPTLGTTPTTFFYLRVWNRGSDLTSAPEIPFVPNTPVALNGTGMTVTLTGTTFRRGDFWIIAARPESPAKVVPWALETGRIAEGVRRFYAPLGTVHWNSSGTHIVYDCRDTFDPLIDRRGCCITVSPTSAWQHTLDELADEHEICICFQPGDYSTTRSITLRNHHVQLHGAGQGSRIHGQGIETVLRFEGCTSVQIADIAIDSNRTSEPGVGPWPRHGGAITLANCDHVDIARVTARCAPGTVTSASSISAHTNFAGSRARLASIRVKACTLIIGANQVGLTVVNYGRSTITDNLVHVDPTENAKMPPDWFHDTYFRRTFRRALLYQYGMDVASKPADAQTVQLANRQIWIRCPQELKEAWQTALGWRPYNAKDFDYSNVGRFIHHLAGDLIYGQGIVGKHKSAAFANYFTKLLALRSSVTGVRTVAAQGIVIAGTTVEEVRVHDNTIRDVLQGIHIGASAKRTRDPGVDAPVSDTAGRVVVSSNTIQIAVMPEAARERHGIFVGNVKSAIIENNYLRCERLGNADRLGIEGIRLYGFFGPMINVAGNHVEGFPTGIRFAGLNNMTNGSTSLWRVSNNLAAGSTKTVDTALRFGDTFHTGVSGNVPV